LNSEQEGEMFGIRVTKAEAWISEGKVLLCYLTNKDLLSNNLT